jgi:isoamylase
MRPVPAPVPSSQQAAEALDGAGPGTPYPLGVTVAPAGVNVAVHSGLADSVDVCLFADDGSEKRLPLVTVDGDVWHGFLNGVMPGHQYGFRVSGPYNVSAGLRCNPNKLLLDPYGRSVAGNVAWRPSWNGFDQSRPDQPDAHDSGQDAPHSVVVDTSFDWQGDQPPRRPLADTVIYELHVKGFTWQFPAVPQALRGTYAGLSHPSVVDYLTSLGVTAVELLPIHQHLTSGLLAGAGLSDYWGYNSIGFFAAHTDYSAARRGGGAPGSEVAEFQTMVRTLHQAGIEVILDVVFNHTAEGNGLGPTVCFRGLDNLDYYQLVPGNPQYYDNLTGCGNTIRAASPAVRRLALDSLRYWASRMHVDGFRFDLAGVLGSDLPPARPGAVDPSWDPKAAFFELVDQDPTLAGVKLIAEPWMGTGDEQGQFPARWSEWNGRYRDAVRDFWRDQTPGLRGLGASLAGSPDIFYDAEPRLGQRRQPTASINFVTCHDGFTLSDLVAYDGKRNTANLLDPDSGTDDNRSWNCGSGPGDDGPTTDPDRAALRARQRRNFLTTLLLSRGVPMLLAGDERGRTQQGNNNAWCQDTSVSWVDWSQTDDADGFTTLVTQLLALRRAAQTARAGRYTAVVATGQEPVPNTGMLWYKLDGTPMTDGDWDVGWAHTVGVVFPGDSPGDVASLSGPWLLLLLNAYWDAVTATLPQPPAGTRWWARIDTGAEPPVRSTHGPSATGSAGPQPVGPTCVVTARSAVVLASG